METDRVEVADGVELTVDRWNPSNSAGGEPTFLLVHGLASNARLWDGVAARLVDRGDRAITIDLRGHGRSSKPDSGYDVPTVAADLATLIERLGLRGGIVVGQSWGGNVVLELAASRPDGMRGLACVDGGWLEPRAVFSDWAACEAALAPPRLAGQPFIEIESRVRSMHPDWSEAGIRGTLANFERRADGTVAPWLTYEHHLAVLRGLWDHRPSERYPDVTPPVLLLPADGGDADWTGRKRHDVAVAASTIPNARVQWFRGDHDIHAQHPVELADVLHDAARDGFFR